MADITLTASLAYSDGVCSRTCLYSVKNATAGDTMDVGAMFSIVKRAGLVSDTDDHIAQVVGIAGTVLTIPTGPLNDGIWVIICGVAK